MKSSTRTEINVGAGVLARAPLPSHYSLRDPLSPTEIDVGAGVLARAQLPSRYSLRHPLPPTEIDVGAGVLARAPLPSRYSFRHPFSPFSGSQTPPHTLRSLLLLHGSQPRVPNRFPFGSLPPMPH